MFWSWFANITIKNNISTKKKKIIKHKIFYFLKKKKKSTIYGVDKSENFKYTLFVSLC